MTILKVQNYAKFYHRPNSEFTQTKLGVSLAQSPSLQAGKSKARFQGVFGQFHRFKISEKYFNEIFVVQFIGRYDALELSDEYLRITNSFLNAVELQIRQNDVSFVFDGKKWNRLDLYENIKIQSLIELCFEYSILLESAL